MSVVIGDRVRVSDPYGVWFAGWRSTTRALQQAGWQLSVEYTDYSYDIRLLMRHPELRLYGICERANPERFMRDWTHQMPRGEDYPEFVVRRMGSESNWVIHESIDVGACVPVDARPQVLEMKSITWDRLPIFASIAVPESKEIIVDPQDVQALLDQILKVQAPKQAELREAARKNDKARQVHAQLLSIAA